MCMLGTIEQRCKVNAGPKKNVQVHMIRVGNIKPMMSSLCTEKGKKIW